MWKYHKGEGGSHAKVDIASQGIMSTQNSFILWKSVCLYLNPLRENSEIIAVGESECRVVSGSLREFVLRLESLCLCSGENLAGGVSNTGLGSKKRACPGVLVRFGRRRKQWKSFIEFWNTKSHRTWNAISSLGSSSLKSEWWYERNRAVCSN